MTLGRPLVRLPAAGCRLTGRSAPAHGESAGNRNAGTFGKFFHPFTLPEAEKMTALSSIEYPHWLMIAGVLLLILGFVGLALHQRGVEAEPLAIAKGPSEPEADLNDVEVYNRTAKEKRRDRWAERLADEEPTDAKSKIQGSK
jgi:hypothetical protein